MSTLTVAVGLASQAVAVAAVSAALVRRLTARPGPDVPATPDGAAAAPASVRIDQPDAPAAGGAAATAAPPLTPRRRLMTALPLVLGLLSLVPFAGTSLAAALRGLWSDLSFTTLQLCLLAWWGSPALRLAPGARLGLLGAVALAGAALYPTALGAGSLDLYRFGYQPWWLLAALAAAGLAACRRAPLLAALLAVDMAAYALRLADSDNLWDYLLDVPLFLYALIALTLHLARRDRLQPADAGAATAQPGTE